MINNTSKSAKLTSFYDTTFKATPNQLVEVLGEMTHKGSGNGKVSMEWVREMGEEEIITIYDWKYYRDIEMNEEIEWHIGGYNKATTELAKEEILTLLNK
jgi:hypothetical protein